MGVVVVMSLWHSHTHPKSDSRGGPTAMADVDNQPEVRHRFRLQDCHVSARPGMFWRSQLASFTKPNGPH